MEIVEQRTTCCAAPVQIEGRLDDGRFFYFRSRHAATTLSLGATPDEAVAASVHAPPGRFARRTWPIGEGNRHPASFLEPHEAQQLLTDMLAEVRALQVARVG